jgi:hypothetical protein
LTILRDGARRDEKARDRPRAGCALVKNPLQKNTGDLQGADLRRIQERSLKSRTKRRERRTSE